MIDLVGLLELLRSIPEIDNSNILQNKSISDYLGDQELESTDQEIEEFVRANVEEEKREAYFKTIQAIIIEQSIESMQSLQAEDDAHKDETFLKNYLLSVLIEPIDFQYEDNQVKMRFNYSESSLLRKKIEQKNKWEKERIRETFAEYSKVPESNIAFIEDLNSYLNFVSDLDSNNYVSRGQKDCTYKLEPSLHRLYESEYPKHAAQYESMFKQRVLYYDESTEKKPEQELLAYGQHFGLPTIYLDFTEAHLTSLLFAVEEYDYVDNHAVVYFVDATSFN